MDKKHSFLGTEKIPKLLFQQSYPAMIGFLVMSLYNIVDTIFIGQSVGPLGIGGLAIAFPVQMMGMALALTIGIGAASMISRNIGAKKYKVAEEALGNFFSMTFILSILMTIFAYIFMTPLMKLFGATDNILPFAVDYMNIVILGTVFIMFAIGSNHIIRAEGNAKFAMRIMIISAIVNLILDPIFIFGFDMGIKGAAYATLIAQIAAALSALYFFSSNKSGIKFHLENLKLKWNIVKETISIGSSSLARNISTSIMMIILNNSLAFYSGDLAIAAFAIIYRLVAVVFMPIVGIVQGLQPIVGFNFGAKNFKRTRESINLSIKASTIISTAAFFLLFFLAEPLVKIFTNDPELISLTVHIQRIMVIFYVTIGFQIVAGGIYQSMGKATKALIISLMRQILFAIPLLLILPLFFGFDGILWAFPISDLLAGIVTFFILRKDLRILNA